MEKLLITGGHVTPALAVIDTIQKNDLHAHLVFVGRKFINDRESSFTFEYNEVVRRHISFIHLSAGRLTRIASWETLVNALKIPSGFIQAYQILEKEKPAAILTFGGYIGLPIAIVGYLMGIPVFTHEQTIYPGIANRIIGMVSKTIFVSFPESKRFFSEEKVVVSGNPIRRSIFSVHKNLGEKPQKRCIYITGGSMGAHSVNSHIERILPDLLKRFFVIHQTGNVHEYRDYERLERYKHTLPEELARNYLVKEHFLDDEIGWVYSVSDFVIGRSGANTFFELVALQKPAVFIPLPWAAHDEQRKQAMVFKNNGMGEIFEQNRPSHELLDIIVSMNDHVEDYKHRFLSVQDRYIQNAAETIANHLYKT